MRQTTGPLAGLLKNQLPNFHDWETLLAVPKQSQPLTSTEITERQEWHKQYARRRAEAKKEKQPLPIEFPGYAPYTAWANQIIDDLRPHLKSYTEIQGITNEQSAQAAELFHQQHQHLADLLDEEEESITELQHELWRLKNMQAAGGAEDIPYRQKRITAKQYETSDAANQVVGKVRNIEQELINGFRSLLTEEQQKNTMLVDNLESALVNPKQRNLHTINIGIACLVTGVGICFLLGFLTRLAALGGILFLLSVMLTQLPWNPEANITYFYYQLVECAAFFSILAFGARRLPGLDYILSGLWCRCCGNKAP